MESERKNLTMPPDWWRAFGRAAAERGLTLSEWMGQCCRRGLPAAERRRLSERPGRGRPTSDRETPR